MLQMMNQIHFICACHFIFVRALYNDRWIKNFQLNLFFQLLFLRILLFYKNRNLGKWFLNICIKITTSWHAQLSLSLATLGSLTIVVAHHIYFMPLYPYLAIDYGTQLSLFTHHMWIGGFLIVGVAAHAAIFMVRDYDPIFRKQIE